MPLVGGGGSYLCFGGGGQRGGPVLGPQGAGGPYGRAGARAGGAVGGRGVCGPRPREKELRHFRTYNDKVFAADKDRSEFYISSGTV